MILLKKSEITIIKQGRLSFAVKDDPKLGRDQVVRVKSSRRDKGFNITVNSVVPKDGRWLVTFRLGDCTEHHRFLAWSGEATGGPEGERGYTDDPLRAMNDRDQHGQPLECVSDWWLKRFAERASERS